MKMGLFDEIPDSVIGKIIVAITVIIVAILRFNIVMTYLGY